VAAGEWTVQTDWARERTEEFLRRYAPWRINVHFSNGLQSFDFGRAEPAAPYPLSKVDALRRHIPAEAFRDRVLDVGHNLGYNSIDIAQRDGARVVGIDFNPRHQEVANQLLDAARVTGDVSFVEADAQTHLEAESFSLVLHLGTLYHLANPVQALRTAAANLRPGGWLALETVAYIGEGADRHLNKWIHGFNGDRTNYWALSRTTIEEILTLSGMTGIELLKEAHLPVYQGEMSRVLYVAEKSAGPVH
jgi:SAM-dependent methyltransferase